MRERKEAASLMETRLLRPEDGVNVPTRFHERVEKTRAAKVLTIATGERGKPIVLPISHRELLSFLRFEKG